MESKTLPVGGDGVHVPREWLGGAETVEVHVLGSGEVRIRPVPLDEPGSAPARLEERRPAPSLADLRGSVPVDGPQDFDRVRARVRAERGRRADG